MIIEFHDKEVGNTLAGRWNNIDYDYQAEEIIQEIALGPDFNNIVRFALTDALGLRALWEKEVNGNSVILSWTSPRFTGEWKVNLTWTREMWQRKYGPAITNHSVYRPEANPEANPETDPLPNEKIDPENATPENAIVAAWPTDPKFREQVPIPPYKNSVHTHCATCKTEVWVGPEQNKLVERGIPVVCVVCLAKAGFLPGKIHSLTDKLPGE